MLNKLPEVKTLERRGQHVEVVGSGELVNVIVLTLAKVGIEAQDIQIENANLEDAFVKLTGHHIHQDEVIKRQ